MKIGGEKINPPKPLPIVLPRDGKDLIFMVQVVTDYTEFEKLCPEPNPPVRTYPGGKTVEDVTDAQYLKDRDEWADNRTSYMYIKSLEATTDLEWETIVMNEPETWKNYHTELEEAGFSQLEILRIFEKVTEVNGLSQGKLDEAMERFLAEQRAE